jgi:thioredoxin 1
MAGKIKVAKIDVDTNPNTAAAMGVRGIPALFIFKEMSTIAVTDETFDAEVKNSDVPVVVDFWAEWCGPCKQIGPVLEELSSEMAGKIKVAKIDVDTNPNTAAAMGVRGIPALFIFKDGEVISNRAGAAPKAALQSWIEDSI